MGIKLPKKPRNPLVAPAKMRRAGAHRPSNQSIRAQQKRDTRRALSQIAEMSGKNSGSRWMNICAI